jgi:type I restriction enzyme S subunit
MNKTLEAMAMALYKHWFVDFGPFQDGNFIDSELGLIPEGWEVKRLDEVAFKKSETFDFSNVEEVIFVNTGDVQEGRFLHSNKSSKIGLPGQAKKAISKDDILYSEIRPKNKRFAYVNFDASDYVVSTKFMIINSKNNIENKILYRILTMQSTVDDFNSIADGRSGTFPQITFDAISGMQMVLPPIQIQNEFQNLTSSMEFKQDALYEENQTLIQLRDTLLPKLISGEVRVKDIEKTVSEAL